MSQPLRCPYCRTGIKIQDYVLEALLRCPCCRKEFQAKRDRLLHVRWMTCASRPSSPQAVPQSLTSEAVEEIARLIAPHSCHQCQAPISQAIGKARTTLVCPTCLNRTSVYAVTFRCRDCSALLEAPTAQAGNSHACPACGKSQVIPASILECTVPAADDAADWFGFYCPSCWDNVVVKKADVGNQASCPHCFVTFEVPNCGHRAKEPESRQQPLLEVHCPRCELLIPMGAAVCPMCQLDLRRAKQG